MPAGPAGATIDRSMIRIKVCCIVSVDEAGIAVREGASALGLVSAMPSGPGVIPEQRIAAIAAATPPGIGTFLLTSATEAAPIVDQQRRCRVNTLQLCDRVAARVHHELRGALPGIALVQVVHVTGPAAVDEAVEIAPRVDALLLDSGDPSRRVKELGGTGRTHDWSISARIVAAVRIPVFLAGGLDATNVGTAIRTVRPFGVDLCSGVRRGGALDEARVVEFVRAVRAAERLG